MLRLSIDPDTGAPSLEKGVWIDDAGRIISPTLATGQLWGGLAQGLGQALMERVVYDDAGQLHTGSLMDYAVPRASDMPSRESFTIESFHAKATAVTPIEPVEPVKGLGEAGCIGLPAALLNAACDALHDRDTSGLDFPLTSERLWAVMQIVKSNSR